MMSDLIPGPHQLGNDIDTYFRHLVEDLKVLWNNNRVKVVHPVSLCNNFC
jgi:hypothetical protein